MDENRNILSGNKVDASTMTDPLKIDFLLASTNDTDQNEKITFYEDSFNNLTDIQSYSCSKCCSIFKNQHSLDQHLEKHEKQSQLCKNSSSNLKKKEINYRSNTDRPYGCTICSKAFKRNEYLNRHMIIHSGNKNEICPECGKAFFRKDHLKKHQQSHSK